jgi:pimeloyl-ACP methyl ester carboxylesterase
MLLVHGFTGTPVMWEPVLGLLQAHHDCHAIALPGHYGGPPFDESGDNLVHAFVDVIERQMDGLGFKRAHIVGNSLGGWIALELASRGRAISTVALSPAAGWELNSPEVKRVQRLFKAFQYQIEHFKPLALEMAARPRGRMIALREVIAKPRQLPGPLAVQWVQAASETPCWRTLLEQAPNFNVENTVEPFDGPLRIAWGTKDRILPYDRYSVAHKRHLPNAEWVLMNKLGHVPMSDDPELVARTILELSTAVDAAG